jgi:hypothetical protein
MERYRHAGVVPLDDAALVAFMPCGHWWVYPVHASPEQMHDLARFNLGLACSFCLAEWRSATHVPSRGTVGRIN